MHTRSYKGFTLLEILISVGILAIVATLIVQVLFTVTHVNKKTELITDVKQNGNFSLDVIGRMVRSAKAVKTSCGGSETSASSAQITNPDNNVTTLECVSDGNAARIASISAAQTVYLSTGNVTVSTSGGKDCTDSSLAFSCPPASGIQTEISVSFTLGQVGVSASAYENNSASFQSTIGMRN
jgi:prepilin-type N-terminal cleavage/methylation domain-containing protein